MELHYQPQATLVDLLDRVLEKGLVIDADIVISLAGVPLIAVTLRATLAGVTALVRRDADREAEERGHGATGRQYSGPVGRLSRGGEGPSLCSKPGPVPAS